MQDEYNERYDKLCKRLDQEINERIKFYETKIDKEKKQRQNDLLDDMEKAIDDGNFMEANRIRIMLEIYGY